jgi:hypothetical protein
MNGLYTRLRQWWQACDQWWQALSPAGGPNEWLVLVGDADPGSPSATWSRLPLSPIRALDPLPPHSLARRPLPGRGPHPDSVALLMQSRIGREPRMPSTRQAADRRAVSTTTADQLRAADLDGLDPDEEQAPAEQAEQAPATAELVRPAYPSWVDDFEQRVAWFCQLARQGNPVAFGLIGDLQAKVLRTADAAQETFRLR